MTISTLKPQSASGNKTKLIYIFLFVLAGVLFFVFGRGLTDKIATLKGKASLEVTLTDSTQKARVFIDDQFVGDTPFTSADVKPGERKVSVRSDTNSYETSLFFLPKTSVSLARDLGVSPTFSSGENLWFEKKEGDTVLRVVSDPDQASVFIDDNEVGQTPFSSSSITTGEYEVRLEKAGFKPLSTRVKVLDTATLNLSFTLFPIPVPSKASLMKDSQNLYDLSLNDPVITSDTAMWVKAIIYWNTHEGINLAGVGVNKEKVFDYFIDYKGNIYDGSGGLVPVSKAKELKDLKKGAYLGRLSDTPGLTPEAKDGLKALNASVSKMALVKGTPAGWLRVRDGASLTGAELTKVNEGESYAVLEEQIGWVKIKVSDKIEGWVSSSYIEITGGTAEVPAKAPATTN